MGYKNDHDGHRDRLKQRFLTEGIDGFEPHNILELILFYGIPYRDTNDTAHDLMSTFGSLEGVFNADLDDLMKIKGVGKNTASLIKLIPQLSKYYLQLKISDKQRFNSFDELIEFLRTKYLFADREIFSAVCLDGNGKLLSFDQIAEGSPTHIDLNLAKVVELVLKKNAACVIIAHNHPAGTLEPSVADLNATSQISDAFKIIGVPLIDHIILTQTDYFSMATKYSRYFAASNVKL